MSQRQDKKTRRALRKIMRNEFAPKYANDVEPGIETGVLIRLGAIHPPRFVPEWLWTKIKHYLIRKYNNEFKKHDRS